ncbi:MAG: hypothetical protein OXF74_11690 [Rhodobacteraceae bacterium]|nr:hypothetical protein [Paracoccaceae bacterium]
MDCKLSREGFPAVFTPVPASAAGGVVVSLHFRHQEVAADGSGHMNAILSDGSASPERFLRTEQAHRAVKNSLRLVPDVI